MRVTRVLPSRGRVNRVEALRRAVAGVVPIGDDITDEELTQIWDDLTAAVSGGTTSIADARQLIDRGGRRVINRVVDGQISVLNRAIRRGKMEMIEFLIDQGADVNLMDGYGLCPLHWACMLEREFAIKLLIRRGANVNGRSSKLETPLMLAKQADDMIQLIAAGTDINLVDDNGSSALHHTMVTACVKLLCALGADINLRNIEGITPLRTACSHPTLGVLARIEVAAVMIACGADPMQDVGTDDNADRILGAAIQQLGGIEGVTDAQHRWFADLDAYRARLTDKMAHSMPGRRTKAAGRR